MPKPSASAAAARPGMQRQDQRQAQNAAPAADLLPPAPAAAPKRNWMGPLAGLAAGLGIAALLSHFGLGEGMANLVMIALLLMARWSSSSCCFVARLRRFRIQPCSTLAQARGTACARPALPSALPGTLAGCAGPPEPRRAEASANIPAGFDVDGFLRVAKLNFVRLQAANDAGNLEDIREFVTPRFLPRSSCRSTSEGRRTQQTDVVTLNAELLEVVTEGTGTSPACASTA
jgi:predicted lipid-binding transport protein (Tim44 family)